MTTLGAATQHMPADVVLPPLSPESEWLVKEQDVSFVLDAGLGWILLHYSDLQRNIMGLRLFPQWQKVLRQVHERKGDVEAVVVWSLWPGSFCHGADISLLQRWGADARCLDDSTVAARNAHALMDAVEALPVPSIAAINGAALGGGLELALACTVRIASDADSVSIGLPEVKLGVCPGAGGTVRLARLLGVTRALPLLLKGSALNSQRAVRAGLVDRVVPCHGNDSTLFHHIVEMTQSMSGLNQVFETRPAVPLADRLLAASTAGLWFLSQQTTKAIVKQSGHRYPAPHAILYTVLEGTRAGVEKHKELEINVFSRLSASDAAGGIVGLLSEQQRLKTLAKSYASAKVDVIGILGGGIMGCDIAFLLVRAGCRVVVVDKEPAALQVLTEKIGKRCHESLDRKRISKDKMNAMIASVSTSTDISALASLSLIIECVSEKPELKIALLQQLEGLVAADTILASNTSTIPISKLAVSLKHPQRMIGMHFTNPAHRGMMVEVIPANKTSDLAIGTVSALVRRAGQTPVPCKDLAGFALNRLLATYLLESLNVLFDGQMSCKQIDDTLLRFGFLGAPFRIMDAIGFDVMLDASAVLAETFGARYAVAERMKALVAAGFLGHKAGSRGGFYKQGKGRADVNTDMVRLLRIQSSGFGVSSESELVQRIVLTLGNEAAQVLADGVVESETSVDFVSCMSLGFPPHFGGALRYLRHHMGFAAAVRELSAMQAGDTGNERLRPLPGLLALAESAPDAKSHALPASSWLLSFHRQHRFAPLILLLQLVLCVAAAAWLARTA